MDTAVAQACKGIRAMAPSRAVKRFAKVKSAWDVGSEKGHSPGSEANRWPIPGGLLLSQAGVYVQDLPEMASI